MGAPPARPAGMAPPGTPGSQRPPMPQGAPMSQNTSTARMRPPGMQPPAGGVRPMAPPHDGCPTCLRAAGSTPSQPMPGMAPSGAPPSPAKRPASRWWLRPWARRRCQAALVQQARHHRCGAARHASSGRTAPRHAPQSLAPRACHPGRAAASGRASCARCTASGRDASDVSGCATSRYATSRAATTHGSAIGRDGGSAAASGNTRRRPAATDDDATTRPSSHVRTAGWWCTAATPCRSGLAPSDAAAKRTPNAASANDGPPSRCVCSPARGSCRAHDDASHSTDGPSWWCGSPCCARPANAWRRLPLRQPSEAEVSLISRLPKVPCAADGQPTGSPFGCTDAGS